MTEIKPSYLAAFCKTFVLFFISISICLVGFKSGFSELYQVLGMSLILGIILISFSVVFFTPRKIEWDKERITIHAFFPGTGEYSWDELEAYSAFGKRVGLFLIKFEGKQAYQIVAIGYCREDWNELMEFPSSGFPWKKSWLWLGPFPIWFNFRE